MTNDITNALIRAGLEFGIGPHFLLFRRALRNPARQQERLLSKILSRNATTQFGRRHNFAGIRSFSEYRSAVPIQDYHDLGPLIAEQELTGRPILTSDRPIYFQRTSGTIGQPKDIPMTRAGLHRLRRQLRLAAVIQARQSRLLKGRILALTGAAVEGYLPGGTPYGAASGRMRSQLAGPLREKYVLPEWVGEISDYDERYLAIATHALSAPDISGMATANPSTFIRLSQVIQDRLETILRAIADDHGNHHRARDLAQMADRRGRLRFADAWPDLAGAMCWTSGGCALHLPALQAELPDRAGIYEFGYAASEFRGTINLNLAQSRCVPTLLDCVFEFVAREDWEAGRANFLGLEELEAGADYYVFVTTPDGLYRYDVNDILRVTGRTGNCPTLSFLQKGRGVANITGEKLAEAQVVEALKRLSVTGGPGTAFFLVLADLAAGYYRIYHEADGNKPFDGNKFDLLLRGLNLEYEAKRASGRLPPMQVVPLRAGSGEAYRRAAIATGQREAQFKVLHLQHAGDCQFPIADYVIDRSRTCISKAS